MLDDLIKHFQETENQSLIARIYGVFTLKSKVFSNMDVILMQNLTKLSPEKHLMFDLKGSTINRKVKVGNKFWLRRLHHRRGLKDVNFMEISNDLGYSIVDLDKEVAKIIN